MCPYLDQTPDGNHTIVSGRCRITRKPHSIRVKTVELQRYITGEFVQNAFPTLSADDREFLMSGTSPEGWELVFERESEIWPKED